jgi:hypothetical protein
MHSIFKFNLFIAVLIFLQVQSVFAVEQFDTKSSDIVRMSFHQY